MKRLITVLFFIQSLFAMSQEEVDAKFQELMQVRKSIDVEDISMTSDPFYRVKTGSSEEIEFNLQAIVDKVVKINNKWYTIGTEIASGYKLVYISKDKAVVSDSSDYLELDLKGNKNVKVKVK